MLTVLAHRIASGGGHRCGVDHRRIWTVAALGALALPAWAIGAPALDPGAGPVCEEVTESEAAPTPGLRLLDQAVAPADAPHPACIRVTLGHPA